MTEPLLPLSTLVRTSGHRTMTLGAFLDDWSASLEMRRDVIRSLYREGWAGGGDIERVELAKPRANGRLGESQISVLRSMAERHAWYDGCGWFWGGPRQTERILDSLVRRRLAVKIPGGFVRGQPWRRHDRYELTKEGRDLARELFPTLEI